jgi:Cu(I)/Ag(I) efflux system membrane fusion protein
MIPLKIRKFTTYHSVLVTILLLSVFLTSCGGKEPTESPQVSKTSTEKEILYYTCGMHPSIRVSPEEYKRGKTNCPICNMNLVPVYKENRDEITKPKMKGVVGHVRLEREQIIRANVETTPARLLHLFKEIRTVGRIAYDPKLAVAQEEFISALQSNDRISKGSIKEITRRSEELVDSSRRKLRLLGMSQEQIAELEKTREVQTNLILPEDKVWVYADVYEFELGWIEEGQMAKVTTSAFPGEEFRGKIISVNPTLDPKTRSVRIRLEIENPDMKLKPDMYVDVIIESMYISPEGSHRVLATPREAVLDTGLRKIVWVDLGNGEFQAREVEVGLEATTEIDGKTQRYLPILKGLNEGELVVTRGNFLIDSQSELTGAAAAAYGGALEAEEKATRPGHQH